ncbi:MAG: hypothetical protein V4650_05990 [Pseudomonadota bacterium]
MSKEHADKIENLEMLVMGLVSKVRKMDDEHKQMKVHVQKLTDIIHYLQKRDKKK